MAHPMLDRSNVETRAQHSRGIRRTERLEVELVPVQLRPLRDRLAFVEQVVLPVTGRRREYEPAALAPRMLFKEIDQGPRRRDLSLFPPLRIKAEIWLRFHLNRT